MLSEVKRDNENFRFDAEYFKKIGMNIIKTIKNKAFVFLDNVFDVSKLAGFEYTKFFTEENLSSSTYYIALTSKNIQNEILTLNDYITIDKNIADKYLTRSKLFKNDVIMSYTGEYRRALTLQAENNQFQLGVNVCRIRNKSQILKPTFLSVFLNSNIGQIILDKEKTLSAQPTIAMSRIRKIPIPLLSHHFQTEIENIVTSSYTKLEESKTLYKQAEDLLLENLDLKNFKPSTENIAIKSFKDSFGTTGRLDSEYYQPKYDEVLEKVKKSSFAKLGNLVNIKKSIETGSEAYSDNGVKYMRVSNLTKFGISESSISIPFDYFNLENRDKNGETELDKLLPKKDTVLLSKDGTVGISYVVKNETNFITSGAILHLNIKDKKSLLPEYLSLVLNSLVVKMQSDRDAGGSIIKHWKPSEISNVLIPKIDFEIQTKIENLIKTSFQLKEKSKQLLEIAKKSVEIAIEKDENSAMEFIKEKNV